MVFYYGMDPCTLKLMEIYIEFSFVEEIKNISMIGYFDYDLKKHKIKKISKEPVLKPGELGAFDDNGVTASCLIKVKKLVYLYYIGWKPKSTTRYSLMTGLPYLKMMAEVLKDIQDHQFLNYFLKEPFAILTAPYVMRIKKINGLCGTFHVMSGQYYPKYDIKMATIMEYWIENIILN